MSEAADTDVAGAIDGKTTEGTLLPRAFLVEASGPATIVREHGDIVERTNGEVEITHRIETLEEFGEFWALRDVRHQKRETINKLLSGQEGDNVHYHAQGRRLGCPDRWSRPGVLRCRGDDRRRR